MSKPGATEFLSYVSDPSFPCVGAKSAVARGNLRIIEARDMTSAWNDLEIHRALLDWARDFSSAQEGLRSLVVLFDGPAHLSEQEFEAVMWTRLQSFADKDAWLGQTYDNAVSSDPEDPHFSLSFGGAAFFVVGLHPNASRPARRFSRPALVFNLHDQFEQLRTKGSYDRMRDIIVERDVALAGFANPMLARHGETSEARQYSGWEVGADWTCPFRDPRS